MRDYTNYRQGRLVFTSRDTTKPRGAGKPVYWLASCDCGNITSISTDNIRHGQRGCGCLPKGPKPKYTPSERKARSITRAIEWNKTNSDARRAIVARYHKNNPHKTVEKEARRRARKREQLCGCCSSKSLEPLYIFARTVGMEVDHIIPLAKGGLHCETNMQLLPASLNRSKGATLVRTGQ